MAILNSIKDLDEHPFGQKIIPHVMALFGDVGEKVPFRTKFNHHKSAVN